MAQLLEMPKLSDTMKEGVLRKWNKKEGDRIAPGDVIAEVETDKATMDFESFDAGVILKRLVNDGTTVAVGGALAIIGQAGEDISKALADAEAKKGGGAGAKAAPAASAPAASAPAASAPAASAPAASAKTAPAPGAPKAAPAPAAPKAAPAAEGSKILASPLARRLATDLGVDLRTVTGSGPGGRIVERDVKAAAAAAATADRPAAPAPAAPSRGEPALPSPLLPERRTEVRAPSAPVASSEDQTIPLSLMRKTIARRLVESKTTIPHFYLTADVDMDAAMKFREQIKEVYGAKLSVNDLVLKATALALRRVPEANASWSDDGQSQAIIRHGRVDISMAVAIEDGLVTPVLRGADALTLGQIAAASQELAKKARDRKLRPEEMSGGTFSVSNLGMMGIRDFQAVINPPEAAILAVGTVRKEPVVKDDKVVVGQRMSLTLSCDHRVVDGAVGAKLLAQIVAILERPMTLAF